MHRELPRCDDSRVGGRWRGGSDELQALLDRVGTPVVVRAIEAAHCFRPSPKLEREMRKCRDDDFEFTARDMTFFDKVRENWPEEKPGALVTEVKEGGWAALGRLANGDIIVAVDDAPVTDVTSLKAKMKQVASAKRADVRLRVARGVHTLYLELEPNWDQHPAATNR
jgi:hypothetical protein